MKIDRLGNSNFWSLLVLFQFTFLLIYFNANIVNVGEMGTALPLLIAYFGVSGLLFSILWLQQKLYFRIHLFIFLLLIAWLAIRIVIDLADVELLKQLTVATTGGMLLFFFLGTFWGLSYQTFLVHAGKIVIEKSSIIIFFISLAWMLYNFSQRMHPSLFYITGVNGWYQRPGNFLSMSFIAVSYSYLLLVLKRIGQPCKSISIFFWLMLYTVSTFMALLGSQLFGSNSATGVILGVYLITFVMSLVLPRKSMWINYLRQKLTLPWSKQLVKSLALTSTIGLVIFITFVSFIIKMTGFDITSLNLLGFGSGSNSSLLSRVEIILETGIDQISYALFLGNINVAYLTTGNAGRTLHSFFPYVSANLGLIGLIIVLALLGNVAMQLYRESKQGRNAGLCGYQTNMIALYSIFIFLYILFFANISTDVSWVVLWFTLGFVSRPFGFK
ncbi:hypothetical protein NBH81_14720 [Aeromonas veronii]|uniref:hypothetical protein n=1 Tax=Aeromonas veronii TaxID=654 RepID=UPI0021DA9BE6|nr:hypothetical protein [Aeromonas veronii]UYB69606.1 hypothetical protein NBH81_14720 [Aeromonas veronii]